MMRNSNAIKDAVCVRLMLAAMTARIRLRGFLGGPLKKDIDDLIALARKQALRPARKTEVRDG